MVYQKQTHTGITGMQAIFSMNGSLSDDFAINNGIKQWCVLALTLFSLYLSAILDVAFSDFQEGAYIRMRKEADLFNVAYIKLKSNSALCR